MSVEWTEFELEIIKADRRKCYEEIKQLYHRIKFSAQVYGPKTLK